MKFNKNKIVMIISYTLLSSIFLIGCSKVYSETPTQVKSSEYTIEDKEEVIEETQEEKEYKSVMSLIEENKDNLTKLVNKDNPLKYNYKPDDLVKPNVNSTKSNIYISNICKNALETMFEEAKEDGINLYLISGFRSSDYQARLYLNSLNRNGEQYTEKYVAKPNYSEHQTGLAVDISSKSNGYNLTYTFADKKEGKWLKENAHKYGFILRYPEDRVEDTGYGFEPWHFRYVGKEVATYIYEHNLILEDLFD